MQFLKNTNLRHYALIVITLIAGGLSQSRALEQPAHDCDVLGSLGADPLRKAQPVKFESIDANAVIKACTEAIPAATNAQELGRYHLQLGRGQLRGGNPSAAISSFEKAAALEYPVAYFALGIAYLLGDDIEKNDEEAWNYLKLALKNNVQWAAKALSELHRDETSKFYNNELANEYLALFKENVDGIDVLIQPQ